MLRGERRRRVQESIIATETSCALVGEEMAEMRERVSCECESSGGPQANSVGV